MRPRLSHSKLKGLLPLKISPWNETHRSPLRGDQVCPRHEPRPRRFRGAHSGDRGSAQFIEVGALALLAASIIGAVMQSNPQNVLNNTVREMVCLVEGPECDGPTWT